MNTKRLMKVAPDDSDQSLASDINPTQLAETRQFPNPDETTIEESTSVDKKVLDRIGQLTRNLHDSLRELGYDKQLEILASETPEAQDRLSYVATKTEQAAVRTLNATEVARPIQEKLSSDATQLSEQWKHALETQQTNPDTELFKTLLIDTLHYLDRVPEQTGITNAQLLEIMMAQDFQDLTGQVIKKITHMVQSLEQDLLNLLLANVPTRKPSSEEGLINGPVTNPEKRTDVVCNQDQVDDLLASLGF
ncbi:MAG: protein phosphatase CheZ [Nitrosomonas sp.]|nr:MAG: protein phosphatase CheZ [Nitrosomonas sp.]